MAFKVPSTETVLALAIVPPAVVSVTAPFKVRFPPLTVSVVAVTLVKMVAVAAPPTVLKVVTVAGNSTPELIGAALL